jgi:hypothetical protein
MTKLREMTSTPPEHQPQASGQIIAVVLQGGALIALEQPERNEEHDRVVTATLSRSRRVAASVSEMMHHFLSSDSHVMRDLGASLASHHIPFHEVPPRSGRGAGEEEKEKI